jgi:osmoprotectant transport system ATP-binding protein
MIEARQLTKAYNGSNVVNGISFRLAEGNTMVLLGTSGCGKTTTLRMLNRLIEPTAGSLFINHKDIRTERPEMLRRGMGYILQRNSLFPHYTVLENISVVPQLLGWPKPKTLQRARELVQKLHLSEEMLHAYPRQLSGGEAQRVNIARALIANPAILLMDEPFSALDNLTRLAIRQEFAGLDELKNKTVVMVTHDVEEAFEMGDLICLMDKGRIVQQGTPEDLLYHPASSFVRSFLSGSFLQLSLSITRLKDIWHYLPATGGHRPHAGTVLRMDDTLARAFSSIQDKNAAEAEITLVGADGMEKKATNWTGLLSAFTQFKKSRS